MKARAMPDRGKWSRSRRDRRRDSYSSSKGEEWMLKKVRKVVTYQMPQKPEVTNTIDYDQHM